MHLTLKLIEQATVLGETGNFAKAAEQLGISQPTLSRNIAALEEDIGLRLFDRGRNGAVLTVFGRVLAERGARVLGEAEALRAELLAVAGLDTGRLEIAAGPYATEDPVAQAVAQLVQERPGLRVRVHLVDPNEVLGAVLAGNHELGFGGRERLPPHDQLALELLKPRRLMLACRPDAPAAAAAAVGGAGAELSARRLAAERVAQPPWRLPATQRAPWTPRGAGFHRRSRSIRSMPPGASRAAAMPCFPPRRRCSPPTSPSDSWPRWTSTLRSCASTPPSFDGATGRCRRRRTGSCRSFGRWRPSCPRAM